MEENKCVPFVVFEAEMVRHNKTVKRFIVALVVSLLCLVATNFAWLHAWLQYDYVGYQALSRDGGNASVIGKDGDIYNGISNLEEANKEESQGR